MNWVHAIAVVSMMAALSASGASRCLKDVEEVNPKRFLHFEGQTLDIRLEVSKRVSHQLSTHIFKIFLEEVLGYPYVGIVHQEDNFNASQVFQRLSGPLGDNQSSVPTAMVNLEVWIPAEFNIISYTDTHRVRDCGIVAPPGRFGWFIPRNLSKLAPNMDHWRIFAEASSAALFDATEDDMFHIRGFVKDHTTKKYYCSESFCDNGMFIPDWCKAYRHKSQPCALLFAADTNTTKFVEQHILERKLFVKVVWVGPHLKQLTDDLAAKYGRENRSLVLLTWTPGSITALEDDYMSVAFPHCEPFRPPQGCKYELQRLVKLAWSKLEDGAKPAYESLHKITFTSEHYENLLTRYTTEPDRSMLDLACDWMLDNTDSWRQWIPSSDEKNILYIGGIFPMSAPTYTARGIVKAAQMALDAVNANDSVLRDYQVKLKVDNGQCKTDVVMKTFIHYILFNVYKNLVGILGPACSDTVEPLAGVTKYFKTIVISYSAEGSSFSDRQKYPYFFRTIGENKQYKYVYLQLLKKMGWQQVAALTEDGQKYTEYISHMQDLLQANGITFVTNRKFPREREKAAMSQYLEDLKSKNARIIIGDVYDEAARAVMCEAFQLKMTAVQGYVWFLPLWLSPDWYNTDKYNDPEHNTRNESVSCTTVEMIQAINGHLALTPAYFAPDEEVMQENLTVGEWKEKYEDQCKQQEIVESNYAGYAYDAVWTYAYALDSLNKENQSYLSDIHSATSTKRYVEVLEATDFNGVSGRIQFLGGPSRISVINIVQWLNNTTRVVGSFYPNVSLEKSEIIGGRLDLNLSAVVWLSVDGQKPGDGKAGPPRCVLNGLAELLDVHCEVAIVVANIIGFGLLGIFLIVAFIIVKRRYDKKVQLTQNYMKSLGIDLLSPASLCNPDKWEIPRDRVVINRKLGEGAFGTVYGGEADFNEKGWVAVAVKTLKVGSSTEQKLDFLSEAEVMKRFEHKNIVKLLGVCTKNEPVYTVMEFMLYGDLKTFLLARRHLVNDKMSEESDEISSKKLTAMALDVARALSYLAELKYVHRDVASRNCLVNATRVVKLADFGMTRPMFENDYYKFNRKGMLPVRWMSPESLALGIFTPSSDVWSYGVLLYEIITFGSFPFQGLSNNQVLEHVKAGNTLNTPTGVKPLLEGLISSCWHLDHKKRPQASEIVEFLANNPRLIAPCLDIPLASVQMEDTGQLEMQLPENFRKCSVSLSFKSGQERPRHRTMSNTAESQPHGRDLRELQGGGTGMSLQENGCVREPLLSSSSGMGLTKYVTLQNGRDGQCDEYCNHSGAPQHAVSLL